MATRDQWALWTDPQWMLWELFCHDRPPTVRPLPGLLAWLGLGRKGTVTPRQPPYRLTNRALCLFDCACGRRLGPRLDEAGRAYLEVKEQYAEGQVGVDEVNAAEAQALGSFPALRRQGPLAVMQALYNSVVPFADYLLRHAEHPLREAETQADLLREVFGYPFGPAPALDPSWQTAAVRALAQAVYEEDAFERLPILGDALEEAGCTDAELLGHLRGPGPHARGCWAVDAILGRA